MPDLTGICMNGQFMNSKLYLYKQCMIIHWSPNSNPTPKPLALKQIVLKCADEVVRINTNWTNRKIVTNCCENVLGMPIQRTINVNMIHHNPFCYFFQIIVNNWKQYSKLHLALVLINGPWCHNFSVSN